MGYVLRPRGSVLLSFGAGWEVGGLGTLPSTRYTAVPVPATPYTAVPPRAGASCVCAAGGGADCRAEVAFYLMFAWLSLHPSPLFCQHITGAFFCFSVLETSAFPGRCSPAEERKACSVGQSWHYATSSNSGLSKASCSKHLLGSACWKTPGGPRVGATYTRSLCLQGKEKAVANQSLMHSGTWWSWCVVFVTSAVRALKAEGRMP